MLDKDQVKLKMLEKAVAEIALAMQDSIEKPVSLNNYLLTMGVIDDEADAKLFRKVAEMVILTKDDPMKLTEKDFEIEFAKISPEIANPGAVEYILKWIGLYGMPKVYPVAMNMSADLDED